MSHQTERTLKRPRSDAEVDKACGVPVKAGTRPAKKATAELVKWVESDGVSLEHINLVITKRLGCQFPTVDLQNVERVVVHVFNTAVYYKGTFTVADVLEDVNNIQFDVCKKINFINEVEKDALESIFAFIANKFKASLKTHAEATEDSKAMYTALGLVVDM